MPVPVPHGLDEIRHTFGDIRPYIRPDGTLRPEWERHNLAQAVLPDPVPLSWAPETKVGTIRCHRLLVPVYEQVFRDIFEHGLWGQIREYGGCFNFRPQRGSSKKLSLHAWGVAIDLNPSTNQLGTLGEMHPGVVVAFESSGFEWGGRWERTDPMHFQRATGY